MKSRLVVASAAALIVVAVAWIVFSKGAARSGDVEPSVSRAARDAVPSAPATAPMPVAAESGAPPVAAARDAIPPAPALAAELPPEECRVRLVDERTNEPLPDYKIAPVGGTPEPKILASDAKGEVIVMLAAGASARFDLVEILGGDDLIQTRRGAPTIPPRITLSRAPDAEQPLDLRVPAGPTYRIEVAPPPDHALGDLRAALRAADPRHAFDVARADLRAGAPPWVRFRPAAYLVEGGPPWQLEVATSDGLWYGSAEVTEREGVAKESVAMALEARARLSGRVTDEKGAPVGRQLVRVERDGASFDDPVNRPRFVPTDASGRYALPALPPGEWNVVVAAAGRQEVHRRVALASLEARELDLTLEALPPQEVAHIDGVVESATGTYRDAVYVTVARLGTFESSGGRVAWRDEGGRAVGAFRVDGLKPGRYAVSARVPGFLAVEPASVEVEAGGEPPRFLVHDDVEQVELFFRATAAGRALAEFRVELEAPAGDALLAAGAIGQAGLASVAFVPRGAHVRWVVHADGFQPSWGELVADGALTKEAPLAVALEPGWGVELHVVDREQRPLQGARISFDGTFAAATGADGRARIVLAAKPQRVAIEYLDWKLAPDGRISPDTGAFRTWEPAFDVVLVPR